jgi:hypothetical protein
LGDTHSRLREDRAKSFLALSQGHLGALPFGSFELQLFDGGT